MTFARKAPDGCFSLFNSDYRLATSPQPYHISGYLPTLTNIDPPGLSSVPLSPGLSSVPLPPGVSSVPLPPGVSSVPLPPGPLSLSLSSLAPLFLSLSLPSPSFLSLFSLAPLSLSLLAPLSLSSQPPFLSLFPSPLFLSLFLAPSFSLFLPLFLSLSLPPSPLFPRPLFSLFLAPVLSLLLPLLPFSPSPFSLSFSLFLFIQSAVIANMLPSASLFFGLDLKRYTGHVCMGNSCIFCNLKVRCPCGASSEPMIFSEIVHYVSVTALVSLASKIIAVDQKISTSGFGMLLRNARSEGDIRDCPMGTNWENVAEKCCRSHYQPLLLLYANPNGTPIHTAEAPQNVIMAPGFKLGSSSQDEYVQRCCLQVDDLMEQCASAESKADLRMAICHCDKAIGYCKQVLALVSIPPQAVNYVQSKHHSCMMKRRALYGKYSNQQQQLQAANLRPASVTTVQSTPAENTAVSIKDTFDTVPPMNGSCPQQTSACEKMRPSDCPSTKIELPSQAINSCDSRKSVDIYGTLPKNQPRQFEGSSASREAEIYQEFLSRQKQLNQQNSLASSGRAYTPTPHSSSSLAGYPSCTQMRPSSTITVSHSRTDSTPESVASCDSVMTTVPNLHSANNFAPLRMNKQEIRQLLQQDMIYRQGTGNMNPSTSSSSCNQDLSGSRLLPTVPSQYNQHLYTTQPNARDMNVTNNRITIPSSAPQPSSSHLTMTNPIPNNNARPSSANSAPQQISGCTQGDNLAYSNQSERRYYYDDELSRPSVKDLASKFEDVSINKNASADNLSTTSADVGESSDLSRHSFRMRSKSESSSTLPKPALSKHQFQQGTRPRKSVTFCDSIALISLTDDIYPQKDCRRVCVLNQILSTYT
ncbi:unnamed protein product [Acanthosepion pharaonis]|uniref:Uncharacterized protein n=1 Tax=Acanthosepion pharaonis TaxID=158019 RepID=A0A812DHI5_ACAPH|nr:unnamed protein product [Sepia pharaonis]